MSTTPQSFRGLKQTLAVVFSLENHSGKSVKCATSIEVSKKTKKSFTPSQIFRALQHLHSSKPFSPDTGEGCRLLNTSFCTLLYECEISHENLSEADNKLRSFRINYIFVTDGGVLLSFEGKTAINSKYSHQQELKTRIAQGEGKKSEKGRAIMMERTRNGAARAQTGAQGGDER